MSDKESVPTLEACPFCGAKPKLIEIPVEVHYYVMCIECGACGSDLHGRQDAINAWNSRVSPNGEAPTVDAETIVREWVAACVERLEFPEEVISLPKGAITDLVTRIAAAATTPAPQLHWPFAAKHPNCAECDREYEAPPAPVEQEETNK